VLCIDKDQEFDGFFDLKYGSLIAKLTDKFHLQRARANDPAKRYLSHAENRPAAILITDPGLTRCGQSGTLVLNQVKEYVRTGGTAVVAANFSSFSSLPDMNKLR
jgi:hypothetical protein